MCAGHPAIWGVQERRSRPFMTIGAAPALVGVRGGRMTHVLGAEGSVVLPRTRPPSMGCRWYDRRSGRQLADREIEEERLEHRG
jgi:hypothetical protein